MEVTEQSAFSGLDFYYMSLLLSPFLFSLPTFHFNFLVFFVLIIVLLFARE